MTVAGCLLLAIFVATVASILLREPRRAPRKSLRAVPRDEDG